MASTPTRDWSAWGVVVVAAGSGTRFGGSKALARLRGRTLLEWCAAAFADLPDRVVAVRPEDRGRVALEGWTIVEGGARRRDSVANGVAALRPRTRFVMVHDAARPLVSRDVILRVAAAASETGAAVPVVPVADTIKQLAEGLVAGTPDRSALGAAQTPQGFRVALLRKALAASSREVTDDASLVEALGAPVAAVAGDARNLKITAPLDLQIAEAIAEAIAGDPLPER
jgi:2-C-methyl-D-erythritol 4-phosphate cytidylyltransferase